MVLDSSALLATFNDEPGTERVKTALAMGAVISTVSLSEVVAKLTDRGFTPEAIHAMLDGLRLQFAPFDGDLAYRAGLLRPATRHAGLSLGDRACLALAAQLGLPALTADRAWATVEVGVAVEVIR